MLRNRWSLPTHMKHSLKKFSASNFVVGLVELEKVSICLRIVLTGTLYGPCAAKSAFNAMIDVYTILRFLFLSS
jgi:hypothetical protein